jgi:hopanoid biosynthesis associated RND transporter like protein HpnN
VDAVARRPRLVVLASVLSCAALLPLVAARLGLNSDEEALFSAAASYTEPRNDFRKAFPSLLNPIVVVVDGNTVDVAEAAAARLAERLRSEPASFPRVHEPEGGGFFESHGLLYLEPDELETLLDRLVEAQPTLGTLNRDTTLRGFASVLRDAADAVGSGELPHLELVEVFDAVARVTRSHVAGDPRPLSWDSLLFGDGFSDLGRRRLLLVQPQVDYGALRPAGETLDALRLAVAELGLGDDPDVEVRLSGLFALSEEESQLVADQATAAGAVALLLVALVLMRGLRSGRLVLAILVALLVGLVWTAAFATVAVGHLNLISVAFAVLFIGLSVDFGIHFGLVFREQLGSEVRPRDALVRAGRAVGGSLVTCAGTTAIGFYAFVATDFLGVAELGLIAGTGMLVSLFANLTVLPALLAWMPPGPAPAGRRSPLLQAMSAFPGRHPVAVVGVAALLAAGGVALVPRVEFDANPLRVRDPSAQSVRALDDLLADGRATTWNVNVLAADAEAAAEVADRLESLPVVERTLQLRDWIPADQAEKRASIADAAFLLLPSLASQANDPPPSAREQLDAVAALAGSLAQLESGQADELESAAARLRSDLEDWLEVAGSRGDPEAIATALETSLLGSLPRRVAALERALQPGEVSGESLPSEVRELWVAHDGRVRVEVFPSEDLNQNDALERYVLAVRGIAPDAFGEGAAIYEIGGIVVRSFREALLRASWLIFLVLLLLWRNLRDSLLVAGPIALAALLTAAGTAALGMSFNFANVIVIPLLLGMGVDTGIHLVHRRRMGGLPGRNLLATVTARAVLLSALTTVASFGTLGFSTHRGMASLGRLLSLGIVLILLCNLLLLPALIALLDARRRPGRAA